MGPKGIAPAIVSELRRQVGEILQDPAVGKQFEAIGAEPSHGSPESLARRMAEESAKWAAVISKANIKAAE